MSKLFDNFKKVSLQDWNEKIIKDLKGSDYKEKLIDLGFDVVQEQYPYNPMMARALLVAIDEKTGELSGGSDPRGGGVVHKV